MFVIIIMTYIFGFVDGRESIECPICECEGNVKSSYDNCVSYCDYGWGRVNWTDDRISKEIERLRNSTKFNNCDMSSRLKC